MFGKKDETRALSTAEPKKRGLLFRIVRGYLVFLAACWVIQLVITFLGISSALIQAALQAILS